MTKYPDDQAKAQLHTLLRNAAMKLQSLGPEPVAVACANDKFNDAHQDDFWCAVRVGIYFWEQSQFFASPERGFPGYASERAHASVGDGGEGTARLQASLFDAARTVLDELEKAGWRSLAEQAFARHAPGNVFALVHQFDQDWLIVSDPRGGPWEQTYAVCDFGIIPFATTQERMDDLIGRQNLVRIDELDPLALSFLSAAAQRQFRPNLEDPVAADELRQHLVQAAKAIRAETDERVVVTLPPHPVSVPWTPWSHQSYLGPVFEVRDVPYTRNGFRELRTKPMNEEYRQRRQARYDIANFEKIDTAISELDRTRPREQFERAFGVKTYQKESIKAIFVQDFILIFHESKLFLIDTTKRWSKLLTRQAPIRFVGYSTPHRLGLDQGATKFSLDNPEQVTLP